MPRARLSHASLIASADSPLLPFLAPRVFAESPIPRTYKQYGGKDTFSVERVTTITPRVNVHQNKLRSSASLALPPKPMHDHHTPNAIGLRYADIFSFARQHIRDYSTNRITGPRSRSVRYRTTKTTSTTVVLREASPLQPNTKVRARRRIRALLVERRRLDALVAARSGVSFDELFKEGDYRSLRRRIINLSQWNVTQIDFRRLAQTSNSKRGLLGSFAALDRKLYLSIKKKTHRIRLLHHPQCPRWSSSLLKGTAKHETHQVWSRWMTLDIRTRKKAFRPLLIYLLDRKPGRAMQFVYIIANDPILRGMKTQLIADALGHLSKTHVNGVYGFTDSWSSNATEVKRSFAPAFVHIYQKALAGQPNVCSQDLLYNTATIADPEDLKRVFECLVENQALLSFDTFLHYANAFAKAGEISYALACLKELRSRHLETDWASMVRRERFRWTCALVLRKSMSQAKDYHNTPTTVAVLVELGVKMDIRLYNVVMHNAMDAHDYATAFKVYNTLESNELQADKFTYSILLHGCSLQENPVTFSAFAEHCAEIAIKTKDPWLATDYLYYLYVRHQGDSDKAAVFSMLWDAYRKFFTTATLRLIHTQIGSLRLPLDSAAQHQEPISDKVKLEPPPVAAYIMLQMAIQLALATSNRGLVDLYERFKAVVKQDEQPTLAKLAENPIIWNAFLHAFCQKQQFASASQLIKDMTDSSPQPNIYSWNIFMQAFFKTGQVKAAERVFEIMRNRGVEPDQFSYGVLLRGYARAQHVERVGEVIEHLDTEAEMDPGLLRALAKLTDRKYLMSILDKTRIRKEHKAREKATLETKKAEERWKSPFEITTEQDKPKLAVGDEAGSPDVTLVDGQKQQNLALDPSTEPQTTSPESEHLHITHPPNATDEAIITKAKSANNEESKDFTEHAATQVESTSPESASPSPVAPQKPPTPKKKHLPKPLNPETQYKILQQKLGLTDAQPTAAPPPANDFGAGLGYKSVLPNSAAKPELPRKKYRYPKKKFSETTGQVLRIRKMNSRDSRSGKSGGRK